MDCEHCLNRRDFLARAAATTGAVAALAAITACGDGQLSGVQPRIGGPVQTFSVKVGDFSQLATAGVVVQVAPVIAVKRVDASTFIAFDTRCTHEFCGTTLVNQRFECPCHGSIFDSNGSVVRSPAVQPLGRLTTSYDSATDTLTIG